MNIFPGWLARGMKLVQMLCQPAVSVVVATNAIGRKVTQAYCFLRIFTKTVVPTHSPITASTWLAIPNLRQRHSASCAARDIRSDLLGQRRQIDRGQPECGEFRWDYIDRIIIGGIQRTTRDQRGDPN